MELLKASWIQSIESKWLQYIQYLFGPGAARKVFIALLVALEMVQSDKSFRLLPKSFRTHFYKFPLEQLLCLIEILAFSNLERVLRNTLHSSRLK